MWKTKRVIGVTLLIFQILCLDAFGVERRMFSKISLEKGLSHSAVFDIVQDSLGYMWFATQDGLNRYNGYQLDIFKPDDTDPRAIISSNLRSLCIDRKNRIWVGGENGVSYYDYSMGGFKNFSLFQPQEINSVLGIVADEKGAVWLSCSDGGIYLFNEKESVFERVKYGITSNHSLRFVEEIVDAGAYLLLCSQTGFYRLNKENFTMTPILIDGKNQTVHDVVLGRDGSIWVATAENGVYLLDERFNVTAHFAKGGIAGLMNNKVRALGVDKSGMLWIGTYQGLSILNPYTRTCENYADEDDLEFSLSQNSIRSIFVDRSGGVWVGTFYGGVSYYHPNNIRFRTIDRHSGVVRLNDNVVNFLVEGPGNKLWIGTNDHGLNCLDLKSDKITYYNYAKEEDSRSIKSILPLQDGTLLVGTHWGGLHHYSPGGGVKVYKTSSDPNSISDNRVSALLKDHSGNIWVGTYNGLERFDLNSGQFIRLKTDSRGKQLSSQGILSLCEDSHNRLWVGTFYGLNIYHPETNLFETFSYNPVDPSSLSRNEVTCVFEDRRKRIWIGTSRGLNLFDEVTRTFRRFTTKEGLINNFICSILEDEAGNLWVSSYGGLMKYNPTTERWQHFVKKDGLQSNQFNHRSACCLSDGRMAFGGINGATLFNPDNMMQSTVEGKVMFNELLLNNVVVRPNDESGVLTKHICLTDRIALENNQRVFTIKFSPINYNENNTVTYLYKLEGLHDDWISLDNSQLTFSDLPVGVYRLCVKVDPIYTKGEDSEVSQIEIEILPPWWRSDLMCLLYWLIFVGVAALIYREVHNRVRMHNELSVEKLKKQKMEELQTMQMQFFINVSHEFKTPLSLIISPLEKLRLANQHNEWQSRQLDLIYKNATSMLSLIERLINFRKVETGQEKLHVCKGNLEDELSSIYSSFYTLAKGKGINYQFDVETQEVELFFDSFVVERICFNFLSNAFKFTPSGGQITLRLFRQGDRMAISVKDSGKGIAKDQQVLIFERFYSVVDSESVGGTGIGLTYAKLLATMHHGEIQLVSDLGKGSEFTFYFPLTESAYTSEEIFVGDDGLKHSVIPQQVEEEEVHVSADSESAHDKQNSILVVDDNLSITDYLFENLSSNYNVDIAHDGQEALEMINEREYDLVITDVMMPKMNGVVLCKKIKQNIRTCHISVIMLTAKAEVEHEIEGLDVGADDYIAKPFSLRLLEAKVRNVFNLRKRLRDLYRNSIEVVPEKIAYFPLDQEFLAKAARFVEEHLSDTEFSVDAFAEMMCMSRSNLHLKFKAITGDSISEFIKKIRLRRAIELLDEGRHNIAEISMMTGFSTPSYFSKVFKKNFGYLPTDYKKRKG